VRIKDSKFQLLSRIPAGMSGVEIGMSIFCWPTLIPNFEEKKLDG
jgi:hypothetical protein